MPPNNPNRLIQDLCRSPEGISRLNSDPDAVFEEYRLTETEKAALLGGDTLAMVEKAGVHPILSMLYLLASRPAAAQSMSIHAYPELLGED